MKPGLFLFYVLFWVCGRVYHISHTYLESRIVHSVGLHVIILFLLFYIVAGTPYSKIKKKVFWGYFFIYEVIGFATFCIAQFKTDHVLRSVLWEHSTRSAMSLQAPWLGWTENLFIPMFVLLVGYQVCEKMSAFDYSKSAKVNTTDIFLVLRYPKNIIGLLLCIFTPIKANTVALYADGRTYRFSRRASKIVCEKTDRGVIESKKYFLINTGMLVYYHQYKLDGLIGTSWTMRVNCLTEFQKVIGPLKKYLWGKNVNY